jgi:hypothetical protein
LQSLLKFPEKRSLAFTYCLQAATEAFNKKSYRDGLHICYEAARIAHHEAERNMIRDIAQEAQEQLQLIHRSMAARVIHRRRSSPHLL